jgi:hypothetical protein
MTTFLRTMQNKVKKISNLKRDDVSAALSQWFKPYAALVDNVITKMIRWHNKGCDLLFNKDAEWSSEDVNNLLRESQGMFPFIY